MVFGMTLKPATYSVLRLQLHLDQKTKLSACCAGHVSHAQPVMCQRQQLEAAGESWAGTYLLEQRVEVGVGLVRVEQGDEAQVDSNTCKWEKVDP
jgi:hypothetical protein